MAIPVALRGDFKAPQLRGLASKTKDGPQARRLLALAFCEPGSLAEKSVIAVFGRNATFAGLDFGAASNAGSGHL